MKLLKFYNEINKIIKKTWKNNYGKILIILFILMLLCNFMKDNQIETFNSSKKFIEKHNDSLYDNFYVNIYDQLVYDENKNKFEYDEIKHAAKINKNSTVLDIGSGLGHHVNLFNNNKIHAIGMDKSKHMINAANKKYPKSKFILGDALNTIQFQPSTYSHILSLYFTLYYIKDKRLFFKNCYDWLIPGGKLVIHLVNRNKFDPIINAGNPLNMVSPQKYAKDRITESVVKFNDFKYKSKFFLDKENDSATFKETFINDNDKSVRQNNHTLYMDTQKNILNQAINMGFILEGKIDMTKAQYEYQYLYVLKKPN